MTIFENFIIITPGDLVNQNHSLESFSRNRAIPQKGDCDCDCACPTDSFTLEETRYRSDNFVKYIMPSLHMENITDEFSLVFNPLGSTGVVVINEATKTLLQKFKHPKELLERTESVEVSDMAHLATQRLIQLDLLRPLGTSSKLKESRPETLTTWLHVTNECNLRCPYCYVSKSADNMEIEQGRKAVEAVFRSALANRFGRVKLKYAGGEATLNFHTVLILHDYAKLIANQHNLELDSVVLSNGVALSNRMITEMKHRGIQLMISLDGIRRYQDENRPFINGKGSFYHVERALDRLSTQDFTPSISITISSRNLEGLPETVGYLLARKLPFTINFFRENECSGSFNDLKYQDEAVISAMKKAFAVIEANLPFHSLLGAVVDRANLDTPHDRPCGVGSSYLVINHKGGVAKCHMELEKSITDILVADPLQIIREDQIGIQNPSVDEKEGCRECHWRYWCAGGCPALTYRVTDRFDLKSPNCNIYKAIFPEVLRLEGLRLLKYSNVM